MAQVSSYTSLQITAGAALLNNQGISVPATVPSAAAAYNGLAFVQNLQDTISAAAGYGLSAGIIATLKVLTANTCAALSGSVPTAYANTTSPVLTAPIIPDWVSGGFGNLLTNTANRYLGSGNVSTFAAIFGQVAAYRASTNTVIYSVINSTNYLGPTFINMDSLISGGITDVTLALPAFAEDVAGLGRAINFARIQEQGTPTNLLQTISENADIVIGTVPSVERVLLEAGITQAEIVLLATPQQSNLTLSLSEFNSLQQRAYQALTEIQGDELQEIYDILGVTNPKMSPLANGANLARLLDTQFLFPNSWPSMTLNGNLIYDRDGTVTATTQSFLRQQNSRPATTATGCDELAKIIPANQALGATALGLSLQQIKGVEQITAPDLARALA